MPIKTPERASPLPQTIAILEDNAERRRAMEERLRDRFRQYDLRFFVEPQPMIEFFADHLPETILISLDHDIDVVSDGQGGFRDPGTGRLVADFLVGQPAVCPVVIHSTNAAATVGMKMALEEAGWTTHIVAPYDDLAWIHEEWIYTVRKAILDTARTAEA